MDPFTHALTSAALDRAGLSRVSRLAMAILIVSGVAADLDLLSYFGGAEAYFHYAHTLLHSITGSAVLVIVIALIFWLAGRRHPKSPLKFGRVFLLCAIGATAHVLLDLATASGVQLFWPFRARWFSWDLLGGIDPWILAILLAGLLVPGLFRLVSEEIGEKKKKRGPSKGAIAAVVLMLAYVGWRAQLHYRAGEMLLANDYHGQVPMVAGAFPDSSSPLSWRGVVDTANTIEEVNVRFGVGAVFDATSSLTHYKPEGSAALDAARRAPLAQEFLRYARFPLATQESLGDGYRVTLRDLRFRDDVNTPDDLIAVIDLDSALKVRGQTIEFANGQSDRPR
ncbi:MAG: metal-dependent hydrolase [Candidatus Acidiferrales bacterium]